MIYETIIVISLLSNNFFVFFLGSKIFLLIILNYLIFLFYKLFFVSWITNEASEKDWNEFKKLNGPQIIVDLLELELKRS